MTTKRFLTTFFFLFIWIFITQAQNSASATMQVSVTVIEGASLQVTETSPTVLHHENCNGGLVNLANVTLAHSEGHNVHITQPDEVYLKNKEGEVLTFRRVYTEEHISKDRFSFQMNYSEQEHAQQRKGNYKGSMTTSIAYN